jgi:hypothetical protein
MNRETRQSNASVPFFARFLEAQDYPQVQSDVKAGPHFHTLKYPSDNEEGGGYVTLKYPSDDDEGGVTV